MAHPIIDVEEVFSDFVEEYGGVVSDRVTGKRQKTSNADFIFHESKVIAELKILKEDPFSSPEFRKSRKKKMQHWLQNGDITLEALKQVKTLGDLPPKCYRDAEKLYTRPVRTHLEKANQQIKSTKQTEQVEDYKGLLILVSDGNYFTSTERYKASGGTPPSKSKPVQKHQQCSVYDCQCNREAQRTRAGQIMGWVLSRPRQYGI
jgi:hypothetical protein